MSESHISGCILGTAVGDSVGLPYEGVSRKRLLRLLGKPDRHRFLFGHGMVSDDTEHSCMVAQSLIAANFDVDTFTVLFARRLRWWFLMLPAGVGFATMRACLKLWLGFPARSSGVFSAGNGPAMRSAIFGAVFDDVDEMAKFVRASSRITHSDPKAEHGAMAVALAAMWSRQRAMSGEQTSIDAAGFVNQLADVLKAEADELVVLLRGVLASVESAQSTIAYADSIGLHQGVTGYVYHTVPVVIHAWLLNPDDFRAAVSSVIECGGDADTTAAIIGGIVGTGVGESAIPPEWISSIIEWPRSVTWMRRLARQLFTATTKSAVQTPISLNPLNVCVRNLFFLMVVLFHGLRRLLPPF